jgi:hypothetical protein
VPFQGEGRRGEHVTALGPVAVGQKFPEPFSVYGILISVSLQEKGQEGTGQIAGPYQKRPGKAVQEKLKDLFHGTCGAGSL